jgi:hypothetical protein
MAIFSIAMATSGTAGPVAVQEVIPGANNSYRMLEFGLTMLTAGTTNTLGLTRALAAGTTPTSPQTVLAEDAADTTAGNTTTAVAWATAPTVPTNFLRRLSAPATIGAGSIWTFPRGLKSIKGAAVANNNITLFLIGAVTAGTINTWFVVDE